MNLTYFSFLFKNTIKRKSLWITWIIFAILSLVVLIVIPALIPVNLLQVWANTMVVVLPATLGFMIAVMTAILAIIVFKEPKDNQTDLVVISKRVTKRQLVLNKFLVYAIICLIVNLSICALSCLCFALPDLEKQYWAPLFTGMLVGNLVSFAVFGAIACLVSSKLNKPAILVVNTLLVFIAFAYQIIGWLSFSSPLTRLQNNNAVVTSYIVGERNKDGSYKEEHIGNFLPTTDQGKVNGLENIRSWQDIVEFWNDLNISKSQNVYTGTSLSTQLGLTYLSTGLDKYSKQQAERLFGLSSFYNYNLISPASPEIINNDMPNAKALEWIYTGHIEAEIEIKDIGTFRGCIPYSIGFMGYTASSYNSILNKTFGEKLPIGEYKSQNIAKPKYVYLEKDEWSKYENGFTNMYNTIFRYDLLDKQGHPYYDLTGLDEIEYLSAWCSNNNLSKYYDLVWYCLNNKANLILSDTQYKQPGSAEVVSLDTLLPSSNFNISDVDDLNTRFIQFKYLVFHLAQQEQKQVLDNGPIESESLSYLEAKNSMVDFTIKTGIKWKDDSWYMYTDGPGSMPKILLDLKTLSPAFPLLHKMITTYRSSLQDPINCSYSKIMRSANIYKYCSAQEENYLFTTLDESKLDKRSDEWKGRALTIENRWVPGVLASYAHNNHNISWFYYDVKQPIPMTAFIGIWLSISVVLFGSAWLIYRRYDIQ